jgi:uncharacterized repeat protein (TIGR03803 family)
VRQLEARLTPSLSAPASFGYAPAGSSPESGLVRDSGGNLFGTAYFGGPSNAGTIFEVARGSGTITILAPFDGTNGGFPQGTLLMDSSGDLYGTAVLRGAFGDGTVFELAHGSSTITTLASFNGTDGKSPMGGVIMDGSGNLYGTTEIGGASGDGTVFELAKGSGTITTLASFNGTDGKSPFQVGLVMDSGGNLFGTTRFGGASNDGTVFEVAAGSGTITALASFNGTDGQYPLAGLVMDGGGNLYGTAYEGGASGGGTVFELVHGSSTITTLGSFGTASGVYPRGPLILDGSGNLYGTTQGAVYEVTAGSGTITTLALFNGTNSGSAPVGALVMDGSGDLYGTTALGGPWGVGTVYEVAAGSGSITTLASFTTDGKQPGGPLIIDGKGNLYGTAKTGGASNDGTVFELAAGSGSITTLASFNGTGGANPDGGLLIDGSGNLYGTTSQGGANGDGTVFELAAGSGTITTLASFDGTDGSDPTGTLVIDGSGNLYGTTYAGGALGDGTVFELAAGSGTITTLASFTGTDGANTYPGVIRDSSGDLYGTTWGGGASGDGTVFEVAAGSGTITDLASFDGTDGANPRGGLIMDGSGNLYGTTTGGGASSDGTVFELVHGSATITTLASFDQLVGGLPYGGLVMDSSGNLYGTAYTDGNPGYGTVFEVVAGSGTVTPLVNFDYANGAYPTAGLTLDGSGNLYGTTTTGYINGNGTVFELPKATVAVDQWTGANFAVDTNWSDGANWSLGVPPYPNQTALFTNNATVKGFTATVDPGFTNPIWALDIDSTWGGTIGGDLVLTGASTLTNNGTIIEAGANSLVLENTATLSNAAGATIDLTGDGGMSQSGGGTLTNAGILEKTGGTGTSTIATTTLSNTGTFEVASGTLDISAAVAQVAGKTLTAGTWTVTGSATVHSKLDITSAGHLTTLGAGAQATLDGLNTSFTNLSGLTTIATGASFSLLGGQSFTTTGALSNKGSLTLAPGSVLTVSGSFTQTSTGALTTELGGTDTAPTFGQLVSTTGAVTLGGNLYVTSTVVPAVGSAFELLDNEGGSSISGTIKGLREGATFKVTVGATTMKFKITYSGKDSDGKKNVVITRTS